MNTKENNPAYQMGAPSLAELNQQLAEALEQNLVLSKQTDHTILDLSNYVDSLEQQLAGAIAACKLKDEALDSLFNMITRAQPSVKAMSEARSSRAIQPDDSALKVWLGEPVAWMITYDGKCMGFVPTEEANTVAVYSPKGLK